MPPSGDEPEEKLPILRQEDLTSLNLEHHCDLYPHPSNNNDQDEKDEQYFIGKYMSCNLNEGTEAASLPSLDVQIDKFICGALLTQENYSTCLEMLEELQKVLDFGTIQPFGSFLMGLANSDSDVDVYFVSSDKLLPADLFVKVLDALQTAKVAESQNYIKQIRSYKTLRVPFIRFTPSNFNISCDLSFENTLGAQNSRLILFLFSLNPVMRPLTILLKRWAQSYQLNNGQGLKGYAIALLVVFFMVRKKYLPSIHLLQSLVPPKIVDGFWNVVFCSDVDLVRKEMEKMEIKSPTLNHPHELIPFVLEFFHMLTNLTSDDVICTLTGEFINRQCFTVGGKEDRLPPSQARFIQMRKVTKIKYKKFPSNKRISLQDPFDLAYNVMNFCYNFTKIQRAVKETVGRLHGNFLENSSFSSLFIETSGSSTNQNQNLQRQTRPRKIKKPMEIKPAESAEAIEKLCSSYKTELESFAFRITPQPMFFRSTRGLSWSKSDLDVMWYDLVLDFLNTHLFSCLNSFHNSKPREESTNNNDKKQTFSTTFQLSVLQSSKFFTRAMSLVDKKQQKQEQQEQEDEEEEEQQQQTGETTTKKDDESPPFFRFSCRFEYECKEDGPTTPQIIVYLTQLTTSSHDNDSNSTIKLPMNAVIYPMRSEIFRQLDNFMRHKLKYVPRVGYIPKNEKKTEQS